MNIFYKIWCFFMDSKNGYIKYCQECEEFNQAKNGKRFTTFITFAPYPGRLGWRSWRIIRFFRALKYQWHHRNYPKNILNKNILKIIKLASTNEIAKELVGVQAISTPDNAIFTITYIKEKK